MLDKTTVPSKFDRAAGTYDLLTGANPGYHANLVQSVRRIGVERPRRLLDLCCGTGASTRAVREVYPDAELVGLDASAGMLEHARKRTELNATFVHGDAMNPRAAGIEGTFDVIFMAYGIRNMPDTDVCLDNLLEMLEPGGVIAFHDYSLDGRSLSSAIWGLVCWLIIIPGGLFTSGSTDIYRYLWRSALEFDRADVFEDRLARHGFDGVRREGMTGWQHGIVHTFVARRPEPIASSRIAS
jgi:ubiquinone/menaquinone biosynthesis C-methylase UbiE